jgi:hypothetical protein
MSIMISYIPRGLETKCPSDFDILVTLAEDVGGVNAWVISLDPQWSFLSESRANQVRWQFVHNLELVSLVQSEHQFRIYYYV